MHPFENTFSYILQYTFLAPNFELLLQKKTKLKLCRLLKINFMQSIYLILYLSAKRQINLFAHNFCKNFIKIKEIRRIMNRFIYVIKILSIETIHFTQLTFPPHSVLCWIAHNPNFQPFSAGNINSPVNTMSCRHHPDRTDD